MNYDPEAAERVRQVLSNRDGVVEKRMVGGLSFLVNGYMYCGITDRSRMVRVGAKDRSRHSGSRTCGPCNSAAGPCPASSVSSLQALLLMTRSPAGCSGDSTSLPGSQPSPSAPADDQPSPRQARHPRPLPKVHSKARAKNCFAWVSGLPAADACVRIAEPQPPTLPSGVRFMAPRCGPRPRCPRPAPSRARGITRTMSQIK